MARPKIPVSALLSGPPTDRRPHRQTVPDFSERLEDYSARKDVVQLEVQPLKHLTAQGVPAPEGIGELEAAVPLLMHGDGLGHRIDDPVLEHAVSAVQLVLVAEIAVGGGRREYLDDEVGRG